MTRTLLTLLFTQIFVSFAAYAGNCDWAKTIPTDDANYKYFVSIKHSTKSIADAENKVEQDVNSQLCDQLGSYVSSASDFYESGDVNASGGISAVKTRCVGIRKQDFSRIQYDSGKSDGEYFACVKYRYPIKNLQQEKQRIQTEGFATASAALNEYMGNTDCEGMPLSITTTPAGAMVSIDDSRDYFGKTPLKFGNVCAGNHTLRITLDNYDSVVETIKNQQAVHKNLVRSKNRISINTNVGKSTIIVSDTDGFEKGRGIEPYSFDFLAGIPYKITVENDAAQSVTREYTFSKSSASKLTVDMKKIPGTIDFTVFKEVNPDVSVYVDDKFVSGNAIYNLDPDKSHNIKFSKGFFVDINEKVNIKGGQTYSYPASKLEFSTDDSWWAQKRLALDLQGHLGAVVSDFDSSAFASIELGLEKRLFKSIGMRGAVGVQYLKLEAEQPAVEYTMSKSHFIGLAHEEKPQLCPEGKNCEKIYFWGSAYNYDYGYFEDPTDHNFDIKTSSKYTEPFYANCGLMLGQNIYAFAAGALGKFNYMPNSYAVTLYDFAKTQYTALSIQPTDDMWIFRYGGGLQWIHKAESDILYGIRMQYLTSNKIDTPNLKMQIRPSGNVNSNPDYAYKYTVKNIKLNEPIKRIQSFNISVFVGF